MFGKYVVDGGSELDMRNLVSPRISFNYFPIPLNQSHFPKFLCVCRTSSPSMADGEKVQSKSTSSLTTTTALNTAIVINKQQTEERPSVPPPPEKPLPGDCCGSGCVRCVWDIYYDELEEYNKLYKSKPDSVPNVKQSDNPS